MLPKNVPSVLTLAAFALLGCSAVTGPTTTVDESGPQQAKTAEIPQVGNEGAGKSLINLFRAAYNVSSATPSDAAKAREMYRTGAALVESSCRSFFRAIGKERQHQDFYEKTLAIGGTAATAATGVAGASATVLTLLSGSLAGLQGINTTYDNVYLFGPDTQAVEDLVIAAFAAYKEKVTEINVLNFTSAQSYIEGAQQICEVQRIRQMVNVAIATGKITAESAPDVGGAFSNDLLFIQKIADIVAPHEESLSTDNLAALYWYYFRKPEAGKGLDEVKKLLSVLPNGPVESKAGALSFRKDYGNEAQKIQLYLSDLSANRRAQLNARVDEWLKALEAVIAAPIPKVAPLVPTPAPANDQPLSAPSIILKIN